jgi:hypothetical protein
MPATILKDVRTTITESMSSQARVDRDAGLIKNVKLIGFESKNGRTYPPKALKAAVHLYEGAKVNLDHPEKSPSQSRRYSDRIGVIRNARFVEGQGVYSDFRFNPKHPAAEQLCWDAENAPESLGFSHNAILRVGGTTNGREVIEQIVSIRSMDLVADPATTTSLFESEEYMDPSAPPNQPDASGDPKSAMNGAFRQMIMAAVDDQSLDMKATMKKIAEIMKAQEKLMGGSSPSETELLGDTEESTNAQIQLLRTQLAQYQQKDKLVQLTESIDNAIAKAGLDPKNPQHVSELFSKTLLATESEQDREALIRDRASLLGATGQRVSTPTYKPQTTNATEQIDSKEFARRLLTR